MNEAVVIKSNKYGIQLILGDTDSFEELCQKIREKFTQCEKFFKDAVVAISFSGRKLSEEQQLAIIQTITDTIDIRISCIMEEDGTVEQIYKEALEKADAGINAAMQAVGDQFADLHNAGQFYRGTLRSGQSVESEGSIVIVGDVNPGAKVVSGGNIVVLGALKGVAYAGVYGDDRTFVAALDMDPQQIGIGQYMGRSSDEPKKFSRKKKKTVLPEPKAAVVINGNICIESITKGFLNNL